MNMSVTVVARSAAWKIDASLFSTVRRLLAHSPGHQKDDWDENFSWRL